MTVLPLKLFFHTTLLKPLCNQRWSTFAFTKLLKKLNINSPLHFYQSFLDKFQPVQKKTASFSFVYLEKHSSELGYLDLVNKDEI